MKVVIVGAGVIGTIYGWALSKAGHQIIHYVRSGKASQFPDGIQVDIMDRRKGYKKWYTDNYDIKVSETLDVLADSEIVIVPVRHYALTDALKQIVPKIPEANYLLLTQNWKGTKEIENLLPSSRYVFGDAKAGGSLRNGKLIATIYAIDIGGVDNKESDCLKNIRDLFLSADIKTTVRDNILHYLWVQYAVNGGGWPALVQAGSIKGVLNDPHLIKASFASTKECLAVVGARGVELSEYNDAKVYFTTSKIKRAIGAVITKAMFRFSKYIQRNSAHAMADPMEIKTFYYDLVNTGEDLGISMPAMLGFKDVIDRL